MLPDLACLLESGFSRICLPLPVTYEFPLTRALCINFLRETFICVSSLNAAGSSIIISKKYAKNTTKQSLVRLPLNRISCT